MRDKLQELLDKYKTELAHSREFDPCTTCCELATAQTVECMLEDFIEELEKITQ